MEHQWLVFVLAPVVFPLFFIRIIFLISRFGWYRLAKNYAYDGFFTGDPVKRLSMRIGTSNYNNVLQVKVNYEGIYIRPVFIFKLFHPAVMIPWKDIPEPEKKNSLLARRIYFETGKEKPVMIAMFGLSAKKFLDIYNQYKKA